MTRSLVLMFAVTACTGKMGHHTPKPDGAGPDTPAHAFSHGPSISSRGSSLDVFAVANSASVYQTSWAGTAWGSWTDSGGILMSDVDSTSAAPVSGRVDAVGLAADGAIWHYWSSSSTSQ